MSSAQLPVPPEFSFTLPSKTHARGLFWPPFLEDWDERLEALAGFEPRTDDTVVLSYPKCGHHWSHEFLDMMLTGRLDLPKATKMNNFLEKSLGSAIDSLPSPRIILTHLPYEFLPPKLLSNGIKIIHVNRNPKDVVVSFHNHMLTLSDYGDYSASFDDFFEVFMSGFVEYGSFFEFERRYATELANNPNAISTSFEKLKIDQVGEMRRLAQFLGLKVDDEFLTQILEKTKFDSVKKKRDEHEENKTLYRNGRSLYRRGQVGDWVNHLTVAQSRRVERRAREAGLHFVYELEK